jgi:hypothetical protein
MGCLMETATHQSARASGGKAGGRGDARVDDSGLGLHAADARGVARPCQQATCLGIEVDSSGVDALA